MLSEQCKTDLNQLINHFSNVGSNFMQLKRAFQSSPEKYPGVCAMLRNETMERWEIGGKIANYLSRYDVNTAYTARPAPGQRPPNAAGLQDLIKLDAQALPVIQQMIGTAFKRESFKTGQFLADIYYCCKKEHDEIKAIVDEIARIEKDPGAILMYDKYLKDEYRHKYNGYNPC